MKIVGVGVACIDFLAYGRDATVGSTNILDNFELAGGGLTATALVAAARLGANAYWLGNVGDDWIGDLIIRGLQEEGIDTSGALRITGARSPLSIVFVDPETGERTINHFPGQHLQNAEAINLTIDCTSHTNVIVLDDWWSNAAYAVAPLAKEFRIPIISDIIPNKENRALIPYIDALIVPRHYGSPLAEQLGGYPQALYELLALGARTAVITLGERGCWYSDGKDTGHVPAFTVPVIDTTGAGDVFHGAYAVALAEGLSIRECCLFASAAAALKCTQVGGRQGIPTRDALMRFLAD